MSQTIEISPIKGSNAREEIQIPEKLRCLEHGEKAPKGFGTFRVMSEKSGDDRIVWDCRDLDQIEDAKAMFDELIAKGLVPYRVGIDGKRSPAEMIEFDPFAEEVVFVPVAHQVVGG